MINVKILLQDLKDMEAANQLYQVIVNNEKSDAIEAIARALVTARMVGYNENQKERNGKIIESLKS